MLSILVILVNFIVNIFIYYKQATTPVAQKVIYIIFAILALLILIAYFVIVFVGNHFILKERMFGKTVFKSGIGEEGKTSSVQMISIKSFLCV